MQYLAITQNNLNTYAVVRAEPPTPKPPRLPYLDGLRAVAALYVVLHHLALHTHSITLYQSIPGLGVFAYGRLAVVLFIVLSGYCLMLPLIYRSALELPSLRTFYLRRARRILPPYYAAVGFSVACILLFIGEKTGTHWDVSIPITAHALVTRLLLLQDFTGGGAINHVLWSVAVECHIYLLFPLMIWGWRRFGGMAVAAVTGILCVMLSLSPFARILGEFPVGFVFYFVLGMAAAYLAHSTKTRRLQNYGWTWGILCAVCAVIEAILLLRWSNDFRPAITETLFALTAAFLLVTLASASMTPLKTVLEWKPLVLIGGFSYSLYLVHAPIIEIVAQYAVVPQRLAEVPAFGLLCLWSLPLILFVSYAFYLLFERPFLAKKSAQG